MRFALHNAGAPASQGYFVASIHRFQNIYQRDELARIVDEMCAAAKHGEVHFILHPATELRLKKYGLYKSLAEAPGVRISGRKPYTEFLVLLSGARGVFSDGGSNQEELSYLGVPTILYRERSERPDGLGHNVILRHEIEGSLDAYIGEGGLDSLRRESRVDSTAQPSLVTVEKLLSLV